MNLKDMWRVNKANLKKVMYYRTTFVCYREDELTVSGEELIGGCQELGMGVNVSIKG